MIKLITKLRKLSIEERKSIAFFTSLVATSLIGILWFSAHVYISKSKLAIQNTQIESASADAENQPSLKDFLDLGKQAKDQFGDIFNQTSGINNSSNNQTNTDEPMNSVDQIRLAEQYLNTLRSSQTNNTAIPVQPQQQVSSAPTQSSNSNQIDDIAEKSSASADQN